MAAYKRLVSIRQLYALPSALTLGPTIEMTWTLQYLVLLYPDCYQTKDVVPSFSFTSSFHFVKVLQCCGGRKMGVIIQVADVESG